MDSNIKSIILYGSHARKDDDNYSDIDICVITNKGGIYELKPDEIKEAIGSIDLSNLTLVSYPDAVVDSMIEHGSLFLWHLKQEGKVLYGEEYFTNKVNKLKPFKTHYDEIIYHSEIFQDLQKSWDFLSIPNEFDLSILFTLSRNTCMVLSHKAGKLSFGRLSCFSAVKKVFPDLPMSIEEYIYLSSWKIIYERGCGTKHSLPNPEKYKKLLSHVDEVLNYALNKLA